jgi:methylenetetrahydrofolate reductase (NADPH)
MFFDPELYGIFVADCRKHGIMCPVIPGIMAINNYGGFMRMTGKQGYS